MTDKDDLRFEWDPSAPLAQCEGESDLANQALVDYATMGPKRSQRKLHRRYVDQASTGALPPTTKLSTIKTWSANFAWPARVRAEAARQNRKAIDDWENRRQTFRESCWGDYQELRDLAVQIREAGPAFVHRRVKQGRPRIIENGKIVDPGEATVITIALDTSALARITKTAHDMALSALGDAEKADKTILIKYYGNINPETDL